MIYFNFGLLIRQNKLFGVALVARHVPHSHNVISLILARDSLLLFPVRLYNINCQKKKLAKIPPPTTQPPKKQQKQYSKQVFEDVTLGFEKMYFTLFYWINWLIGKLIDGENYRSGFYFLFFIPLFLLIPCLITIIHFNYWLIDQNCNQ